MTYPQPYGRLFDYSAYQNANPTKPLPGIRVNIDLNDIARAVGETNAFLQGITRSDGTLANNSVGLDQLDSSVALGFTSPVVWTANTAYTINSTAFSGTVLYKAKVAHTSGSIFDVSKWTLLLDLGATLGNVVGPASSTDKALARFSGVTGKLLQNSSVFLDDNGKLSVGVATPYTAGTNVNGAKLSVAANATSALVPSGIISGFGSWSGEAAQYTHGSVASPVLLGFLPSVSVHRVENIASVVSDGSDAAAVQATTIAYGAQQGVAVSGRAIKTAGAAGDICAVYGSGVNSGTGGYAFGGFFQGVSNAAGVGAFAIEVDTTNNSGSASPYVQGVIPAFVGADIAYSGGTLQSNGGAAVLIRQEDPSATLGIWDVGVLFFPKHVKTAAIQDDSDSVHILRATGAHTNGVNLTGATFTGNPFVSTGFSVNAAGNVTTPALLMNGVSLATAWTAYTPTVTSGSGTLTTVSATGAYKQIGKTVIVRMEITITTNGSAAGKILATLPVAAAATINQALSGFNSTIGAVLSVGIAPADTKASVFTATATYPGANATVLNVQGVYEVP